MATAYSEKNVFDAGLDRIRWLYDEFPDIIVSMSGGKDSTVTFELAMMVARERNRLPLKVFWLDQEAEWQHTVDYMDMIMRRDDVKPYWFQIPFEFTNSLSNEHNFLRVWDENESDKWIHPKSDIAITENPTNYERFHSLVEWLPNYCDVNDRAAVLVGMRGEESPVRRVCTANRKAQYKGVNWCRKPSGTTQVFWPIWDWTYTDIWAAIAKNHWQYNGVYDLMHQNGKSGFKMRVSALIHETAWMSIGELQEFEPVTYNRFCRRIHGTNAMSHALDTQLVPRNLPFAFKDWEEYRDYLLEHLVQEKYWDLFRKRWKGQDGEDWHKVHVREVIIQDIDGTLNSNYKDSQYFKKRVEEHYKGQTYKY